MVREDVFHIWKTKGTATYEDSKGIKNNKWKLEVINEEFMIEYIDGSRRTKEFCVLE